MISKLPTQTAGLSAHHQNILRSQLCHLDDRMEELLRMLAEGSDSNAFHASEDLRIDQLLNGREQIERLREAMAVFAQRWQIDMARFSATRSQVALVHLAFLLVDLDELSPAALRGYGPVGVAFLEDYEALLATLYGGLEKLKREIRPVHNLTEQD